MKKVLAILFLGGTLMACQPEPVSVLPDAADIESGSGVNTSNVEAQREQTKADVDAIADIILGVGALLGPR